MTPLKKNKYPNYLDEDLSLGKQILIFGWEVFKVVVISLAIIIPVRYFLIKPFYVKGASMEPNFHDYEYLIIDEITYRLNEPQRGDVVVFKYPFATREYFIKRIIALPDERIEISNGKIHIYNKDNPEGIVLEEKYLPLGTITPGQIDVILSPSEYYLLGDNRPSSLDSRAFGPLERKYIVGRTLLRGWPLSRFGLLAGEI